MTDADDVRKRPGAGGAIAGSLRVLGRVELAITVVSFCSVVVLVSAQVFFRYVFDIGLVWIQEVSQLLILVAYFFGTSFVFKARQYLIITILFDRFTENVKLRLFIATQILIAAFCAMLFVELLGIAPQQLHMKTYILHVPRFFSSLPLLIASISMTLTALYFAAASARAAARLGPGAGLEAIESAADLFPDHDQGAFG